MKPLTELNAYRDRREERRMADIFSATPGLEDAPEDFGGFFWVRSDVDGKPLKVIASRWSAAHIGSPEPWNHVSVSRPERCPTWEEMEQVKRLFFGPDEVAMQLHVPEAAHISFHPFCLHIWQPVGEKIPLPPSWMVA
jgi:hypothetical protein